MLHVRLKFKGYGLLSMVEADLTVSNLFAGSDGVETREKVLQGGANHRIKVKGCLMNVEMEKWKSEVSKLLISLHYVLTDRSVTIMTLQET